MCPRPSMDMPSDAALPARRGDVKTSPGGCRSTKNGRRRRNKTVEHGSTVHYLTGVRTPRTVRRRRNMTEATDNAHVLCNTTTWRPQTKDHTVTRRAVRGTRRLLETIISVGRRRRRAGGSPRRFDVYGCSDRGRNGPMRGYY